MIENRIAKVISYLVHPVFLPLYCLLLLFQLKVYFNFGIELQSKLMLLAFVIITTIISPLLIIYLMKRQGFISSFQMVSNAERRYPYLITVIFYFLTCNMFRQLHLPGIFTNYMLGAAFALLVVVFINLWWKISIHLVGLGAMFGLLTGMAIRQEVDLLLPMMIVVVIAGVTASARLKLNSHKPPEVYTGFLVGAFIMTIIVSLL